MYNPLSTYRIQFNEQFDLKNLDKLSDYFNTLGIGTIYASPVFQAVPGSMHGYNITDFSTINPDIGAYNKFLKTVKQLKEKNIGWIQDFVPNHMAYSAENKWIADVLEKGQYSIYAGYFDIDWDHPDFNGKLMTPFLGDILDNVIQKKELVLSWLKGSFALKYYDKYFPVRFASFVSLLRPFTSHFPQSFYEIWQQNHPETQKEDKAFLNTVWDSVKSENESLYLSDNGFKDFIDQTLSEWNENNILLKEISNNQHYRLCYWKETESVINFRRFFTVNNMICLQTDKDEVMADTHRFVIKLINEKVIDGLRIDHVDGLKNLSHYLDKLREAAGENCYIVTEKILERDETLPSAWPVQGSTGYDFLALMNNLFTYSANYHSLLHFYNKTTGIYSSPEDIIYEKKKLILTTRMAGEWDNLFRLFDGLGLIDNANTVVNREFMKDAIAEFLLAFPVYRIYPGKLPLNEYDSQLISGALNFAKRKRPDLLNELDVLQGIFLNADDKDDIGKERISVFLLRCMQYTPSLMAKGLEDTTMYYYNCCIAHNEVGDSPGARGISVNNFHKVMHDRFARWPFSINATSTHDTKRGEDVRARLNILSELTGEWKKNVRKWMKVNARYKLYTGDKEVPTVNEEYFIYQNLAGIFPFDSKIDNTFLKRFEDYMLKAMREAKVHTAWNEPEETHEAGVIEFIRAILNPSNPFLKLFLPFQKELERFGIINSLSQLILKCACPGIPDIYQGSELWDLSLVDPDNRGKVDYKERQAALFEMKSGNKSLMELVNKLYGSGSDGKIKLWFMHILLTNRKNNQELYSEGKYIPLETKGKYKKHILAFARNFEQKWNVVIIPLYPAILYKKTGSRELCGDIWNDTRVILPDTAPFGWRNILTGDTVDMNGNLEVSQVFKKIPFAVLEPFTTGMERKSGILLHISSLPGKYGIGDFGKEAYEFVDFLKKSRQSCWQILPLTQVTAEDNYSPYSSPSAFAGNTLFISPDLLVEAGLVTDNDLRIKEFRESDKTAYAEAAEFRETILDIAFKIFESRENPALIKAFDDFCREEEHWLEDYALFMLFKKQFGQQKKWTEWPEAIRDRDKKAMAKAKKELNIEIRKEKFKQFIFARQWKSLKNYANINGIKIFGDIPIYLSFDNADVWTNRGLFKLTDNGEMAYIAGVPPDYFSKTGQLWNMPVYRWDKMKENGYEWWIRRLRKKTVLYDLIRIDHFRGFSSYWQVPGNERTAINGEWIKGPGEDFFTVMKKEFSEMPFIAEDLGDVDEQVYELRDKFDLPGMKVLQFAFDKGMPRSQHIPHNYVYNCIVYTGTHDNNTLKGWFNHELDKSGRKRLMKYEDTEINKTNCNQKLIRMAYRSIARLAIIQMQDFLELDEQHRMNTPSVAKGNWEWKLKKADITSKLVKKISRLVLLFNRN